MARTKEFDPDEALEKAMGLFWRKGYLETSIDDLVNETGVSRYGLYGTFGDKRGLFFAALKRYSECVVSLLLRELERPTASLDDLRTYFEVVVGHAATPPGNNGCLIVNTGVELASDDQEAAAEVKAHQDRLHRAFTTTLQNAVDSGALDPSFDVPRHADYFVGVTYGMASLARSKANPDVLASYIDVALETVR
jgi:TetR/AcrR family transcriptional repressor of nem operon